MSKLSGAPLLIGAVAYTPNVVPIWEGIREYFDEPATAMDFVLFSNYGRLVDALQAGMIDIAWNTNLAYARAVLQTDGHVQALAQRDTDAAFSTVFVAAAGSGWSGPEDIATRRLALGSADSAHAAILPLHYLRAAGVDVDSMQVQRFNSDIGKHGDTGRSELDAIDAVLAGEADVAAIGITVWENIGRGDLMPGMLEPVWQTETYSHCMFTALDTLPESVYAPWVAKLLAMDWNVPAHRRILELEGLTKWVQPHLDGYAGLFEAIAEQGVDSPMVVMALMRTVEQLAEGDTAEFAVASASEVDLVRRWCEKTGNTLVSTLMVEQDTGRVTVGRGRPRNPSSMIPADRMPGARLWLYTNFHCNLACDYCCVASSPKTDPRLLGIDNIQALVAEAADWGVQELYLTGGEPFLLPDIDAIVRACVDRLPTTLLTNGMLFRGLGLRKLQAMPREGFALQISVDSPTAEVHDSHRGAGSWKRALAGIRVALDEGFTVRVAATISANDDPALDELHALFDGLGIPRADQVIRPIALQGVAEEGVTFTRESLIPEVTVTAEGIYWHPVAALDEDALVTRQILPLAPALDRVSELFTQQWSSMTAASAMFACA